MKNSTKASLLLLAAIPGAWALAHWPKSQSRSQATVFPSAHVPSSADAKATVALADVESSEANGRVPAKDSIDSGVPTSATSVSLTSTDFAAKYAGKTSYELAGALGSIRAQRVDLQHKISRERIENGEFLKVYPTKGQTLDLLSLATPDADKTPDRATAPRSFYARGGGGRNYIEVSGIPRGQYPEYDQLQAEEIWLSTAVDSMAMTAR